METMSRSPALNPTSTPFFPGSVGSGLTRDDEVKGHGLGFKVINREHFNNSSSSLSISPSDYRSVVSSPSPSSQDGRDARDIPGHHFQGDFARHSPGIGGSDNERPFLTKRPSTIREPSMSSVLETIPDTEDGPVPANSNTSNGLNGSLISNALYTTIMSRSSRLNTPPVAVETSSHRTSSFNNIPLVSSSPASSLDSGSMMASSLDLTSTLENQLKFSPVFNDVLDRLGRLETTTRDIQHQLTDVDRKVRVLLERYISSTAPPEFSNPFAANPSSQSFSAGPRGSVIGNIAPNQVAPPEDITEISHRLNSLTSSVDQLVALSTAQKMQQMGGGSFSGSQMLGPGAQMGDFNPRMFPPGGVPNGNALGHGHPGGRSDMRTAAQRVPNPPMRTWSAGTLDIPPRGSESGPGPLGRPDVFRDKRRSVSALSRRDSAGADSLMSGQSSRDGPIVTKWEQLALAPDLLRSLSTFGVGPPNKIQQRALPFLLKGADIIAQAPPTQERIAAYVIPAIHTALVYGVSQAPLRGPVVVMISTTVDQATQAQRMIRDLGGPVGVKSALGVGTASVNSDMSQELRLLQQNMPHIICGTPQKLHALFTSPGGLSGSEVRFLVLDEVDQLIARNLHDFVFSIVKLLPPTRSRPLGNATPTAQTSFTNMENGSSSSLIPPQASRRMSLSPVPPSEPSGSNIIERQTALFSNTVPQDVLNLATAIQLREPVRVLVRRDGNVTHADTSQGARALRQFYLYLAFTAGGRSEAPMPTTGLGIIGSGRGASSAETAQAREWKLDALADLFEDLEINQAVIHVGGMTALDAVVYKLASRGLDAVPLHGDMNAGTKLAALNKFRSPPTPTGAIRQAATKILVVYDVQVKPPEVSQVPLIINYDLPKAVEEYAHRVAPANASGYSRAGVVVNFVTATGGDVEMLRSIECFYKIKCPEVPMSLRDIV
ncbi:P-loop containing nucleoside triphosphate hydrolase protein [Cristinia sonorae]|uniref:RNA helicase n=1 Tax=Cristinia sonorae TaxID=1940300 RepID=A0A8K0XU27_9AGAR|nr:P-loop containing nucleoside triphosphate hydrolase protein [Cristinia sonorae]